MRSPRRAVLGRRRRKVRRLLTSPSPESLPTSTTAPRALKPEAARLLAPTAYSLLKTTQEKRKGLAAWDAINES